MVIMYVIKKALLSRIMLLTINQFNYSRIDKIKLHNFKQNKNCF